MPGSEEQPTPKWGDLVPLNLNQVTAAAIEILTDLLKQDPEATTALLRNRVQATPAVAEHPHLVVDNLGRIGALGLINGILSRLGAPKVAMAINDAKAITGFQPYKR